MSEQAPTYTTEEGTVGYVILSTDPDQDNDSVITGIKYDTLAEAIQEIRELQAGAQYDKSIQAEGLKVFEVMGIDREAELDQAEQIAKRHGHALISDEAVRELGPTLAAAEEEAEHGQVSVETQEALDIAHGRGEEDDG